MAVIADAAVGHAAVLDFGQPPIDLGQVRGDLAMGKALGRERDDQLIRPGQPALRLATIRGSNDPSRSRGTEISTGPVSVSAVLDRRPLRELPPLRPAGSCLS